MLKPESGKSHSLRSRTVLCVLAMACFWVHPSLGVTNSLTITETAGKTTANYPIQIGRPFAQGEIANFPQAILAGTPVVTQADVKKRWPDGSVKHAIMTFLIPSLAANSSITVTFINQASGNNTGFQTLADMLGGTYDFGATMTLANGSSTLIPSARTMLQGGAFAYWLQGSVATSVIVADHTAARPYDVGFDNFRAFRPIFHATFWPAIGKVRVRFIGEIANTEALEDQAYTLTLTLGLAAPTTVYTKTQLAHTAGSRWTKEFWIGGAPTAISINHNLDYLKSTTLLPNYDLSKTIGSAMLNSEYTAWQSAPEDLYGAGLWQKTMGSAGGRREIGPYPAWTVRWLYTGDARMREMTFGNADLAAAWPVHFREGNSAKFFDRANTVPGVGKVLSTNARPSVCFACGIAYGGTKAADKIVPVGTVTNGGWTPDASHYPDPFSPLYMLSGDYWYLEEMSFWASWAALVSDGSATGDAWGRGPTGKEGGINTPIRQQAWVFRSRIHAASLLPDGSAELAYFNSLIDDAIATWEGERNITGSTYQGNASWNWGRNIGANKFKGDHNLPLGVPTLHFWDTGSTGGLFITPPIGTNPQIAEYAESTWEQNYLMWVLGRARELGYATGPCASWLSVNIIGQLTDSGYSPYLIASYRVPVVRLSDHAYFPTWADVKTGYDPTFDPQQNFNSNLGNAEHGYSIIAIAATSQAASEPGGSAAWAWIAANALTSQALNDNPKWAILPRTIGPPAPPSPPHLL